MEHHNAKEYSRPNGGIACVIEAKSRPPDLAKKEVEKLHRQIWKQIISVLHGAGLIKSETIDSWLAQTPESQYAPDDSSSRTTFAYKDGFITYNSADLAGMPEGATVNRFHILGPANSGLTTKTAAYNLNVVVDAACTMGHECTHVFFGRMLLAEPDLLNPVRPFFRQSPNERLCDYLERALTCGSHFEGPLAEWNEGLATYVALKNLDSHWNDDSNAGGKFLAVTLAKQLAYAKCISPKLNIPNLDDLVSLFPSLDNHRNLFSQITNTILSFYQDPNNSMADDAFIEQGHHHALGLARTLIRLVAGESLNEIGTKL